MNCKACRELLSPYIDSRLAGEQRRLLDAHLRDCTECAEEFAALQFNSKLLGALLPACLTVDLAPKVVARASAPRWKEWLFILQDTNSPRRRFMLHQFGRALAVLALFFLVTSVSGRNSLSLLSAWPARAVETMETGMAELTPGIERAQNRLTDNLRGALEFNPIELLRKLKPTENKKDRR
jgi:anti-sigma factor RsiW